MTFFSRKPLMSTQIEQMRCTTLTIQIREAGCASNSYLLQNPEYDEIEKNLRSFINLTSVFSLTCNWLQRKELPHLKYGNFWWRCIFSCWQRFLLSPFQILKILLSYLPLKNNFSLKYLILNSYANHPKYLIALRMTITVFVRFLA